MTSARGPVRDDGRAMIGRGERLSYAAGDLGFNFVWQSMELYLLYYYVRGLGLSPEQASGIFLAGAVLDWLADPLIGELADRLSPRVPLRLWVLIGGPLACMALVAAVAPPPVAAGQVALYALATHLLLRLAYSTGNIPYAALTARMSDRPDDHLRLTGVRLQGAAVGGMVAALVYWLLPARTSAVADFRAGALILCGLSLPAFLATYLGVRERLRPARGRAPGLPPRNARETLRATARVFVRSSDLRRLLATILAAGLAVTVVNKSLLFLFDEIGAPEFGYRVAILPALSLLVTVPLWTALARRVGRPRALLAAALLNAAAVASAAALLAPGGAAVVPMLLFVAVAISAGSGMSVMFWALVPVAVESVEADPAAQGTAARVYALSSIARKLAQALAPQLVTLSLAIGRGSVAWALLAGGAIALAAIAFYPPRARATGGGAGA